MMERELMSEIKVPTTLFVLPLLELASFLLCFPNYSPMRAADRAQLRDI